MSSIQLKELLNNPGDPQWKDIGQSILSNTLIIDCEGVNPGELNKQQRSDLFYLTQQEKWGFSEYTKVFQNTTDEMADFLRDVIERNYIITDPSVTTPIPSTPPDQPRSGTQEPDTLPPGTIVGHRYKIEKELGGGSFGETYLAKDNHKPGQPRCVVKRLRLSVSEEGTISKAKQLFEQEADVLCKLRHNCIPTLFAHLEENERFYLVQEYIEGDPLDKIIPGQQPWSEPEVYKLLTDILEPLAYLHQQGIIHRDIKPSNLIRRQQDHKIVLIDFGAVRQATYERNQPDTMIGTRGYMPIEQQHGNTQLASDLYAVAMVVIQAATGRKLDQLQSNNGTAWEEKAPQLNPQLKQFINKLAARDYSQRYPSATDALQNIPPERSRVPEPSKPSIIKIILAASSIVIGLAAIGLGVKSIPYFTKPKISVDTVKIGTLWKPDAYMGLSNHLEEELIPANYFDFLKGKKINVIIEGDPSLSYEEAQKRIAQKQWDVAFTLSPINSIFALDNDYTYLAAMFPDSRSYEGGIFVRRDSLIQSLDDLQPTTTVALGGFNSASSFYMPAYTLYGKTVSVDTDNRGSKIIEKVRNGEVDVGAAAIGDSIRKDDPDLRIIHVSPKIPGSGVYLSPQLSESDRHSVSEVMLNAPPQVQEEANYGPNVPEPDYTEFRKIMARVEEILVCSDFSQNPVNFFCPENTEISQIRARVNGTSFKNNHYLLRVVGEDNHIYTVTIGKELFETIVGSDKLTDIQNKNLAITIPGEPIMTDTGLNIKVNQAQQLQIVD